MRNQRILWGRVILYGILTETILMGIFIAGLGAGGMGPGMTTALALVGSFLLPLLFAPETDSEKFLLGSHRWPGTDSTSSVPFGRSTLATRQE